MKKVSVKGGEVACVRCGCMRLVVTERVKEHGTCIIMELIEILRISIAYY
jgi:hypothetical protein